ncbi:MAG: znuA [Bacteroidetes bacterium]|nr:znuA [Bacteroidota bacterium]
MIKNNFYIFLAFCLLLTGCRQKSAVKSEFISVSIEPQRYFAEKIVGDKFKVKTLVPNGSSPESFDPAPSQMVDLGKSRAYFMIGLFAFEKVRASNLSESNPEMLLVDCSKNLICMEHGHEGHSHAHDGHSHQGSDPHIWNSPETALVVAKNILQGVTQIDPANKNFYEANYKKLEKEIYETDSIVKQKLVNLKTRQFIIYHPALSYFAKEYGLEQYTVEFQGKAPSPSQMVELVNESKTKGIKTVFVQPEFDRKNAEVLAKEIGAHVVEINPLAYDWKEEMVKIAEALEKQ